MAPAVDDETYADETYADDTYASTNYGNSTVGGPGPSGKKQNAILKKIFSSCENDALGSVHRAWAVTVLFMVVFFIVAIIEGESLDLYCLRGGGGVVHMMCVSLYVIVY